MTCKCLLFCNIRIFHPVTQFSLSCFFPGWWPQRGWLHRYCGWHRVQVDEREWRDATSEGRGRGGDWYPGGQHDGQQHCHGMQGPRFVQCVQGKVISRFVWLTNGDSRIGLCAKWLLSPEFQISPWRYQCKWFISFPMRNRTLTVTYVCV